MYSEAVVRRCSVNKLFLEISQNSQENIYARNSFLKKLQAMTATLLKMSLWHWCFHAFCEISKNTFFTEHPSWLLLYICKNAFFLEPLVNISFFYTEISFTSY